MTVVLLAVFEALRLLLRAMLLVVVLHFLRAAWTSMRRAPNREIDPPAIWPAVTVQLPLRNEYYVVERVIRAACALDYPREKLDIQVLDDSNDQTRDRARRVVEAMRAEGHRIVHVVRESADGFKAGALNHRPPSAAREFPSMFYAHSLPPVAFLRPVMPTLSDSQ